MGYLTESNNNSEALNVLIRRRNERIKVQSQSQSQSKTNYGCANYYSQSSVGTKSTQFIHSGGFHNGSSNVKPGVW